MVTHFKRIETLSININLHFPIVCGKVNYTVVFNWFPSVKTWHIEVETKWLPYFADSILNLFSFRKIVEFKWKFLWNLSSRFKSTISQHCCRKWLGAYQATSYYLKQWCPIILMQMCQPASLRNQPITNTHIYIYISHSIIFSQINRY